MNEPNKTNLQSTLTRPDVPTISRVLARQLVDSAPTLFEEAQKMCPKKEKARHQNVSQHVRAPLSPSDRAYSFMRDLNYDGPAPNQYCAAEQRTRISARFNVHERPDFERLLTNGIDLNAAVAPTHYSPRLPQVRHAPALTPSDRFQRKDPAEHCPGLPNLREAFGSSQACRINASDARRGRRVPRVESEMGPGTYDVRGSLRRRH